MATNKVRIFAVSLLLLGVTAATLLYFDQNGEAQMAVEFDKKLWTDEKAIYNDSYIRLQMIDDVLSDRLKIGQSREKVVEILGEPTDTPYFKEFDLVYWLGEEKKFISVDSSWLVIKLDDNEKVFSFKIVTD